MKRTDVKTGVPYAYRTSKYGNSDRVIVVLDTSVLWRTPRYPSRPKGVPVFRANTAEEQKRYGWTISEGTGLIAASLVPAWPVRSAGEDRGEPPVQTLLRRATKELAATSTTSRFKIKNNEDWFIELTLVNPRYIVGDYYEAAQAEADEKERRRIINAEEKARSEARVANAQARVEALAAVGITVPQAQETRSYGYGGYGGDWKPDTYTGNTKHMVLTFEQVDQLLSLIPDGVVYQPPPDPNLEVDGWSYVHPDGATAP